MGEDFGMVESVITKTFGLNAEEADYIARYAVARSFARNAVVFSEDDESDGIYIIIKGLVKIYLTSERGTETIFAIMTAGDLFGEMAIYGSQRRSAAVRSLTELETLLLPRNCLENMIANVPTFGFKLSELIAKRLRSANTQVAFSEAGSRAKVLSRLLGLAQTCGLTSAESKYTTIPFWLTHSDLAAYSNVARETVTKKLRELAEEGIVLVKRREYIRLDVEATKKELERF